MLSLFCTTFPATFVRDCYKFMFFLPYYQSTSHLLNFVIVDRLNGADKPKQKNISYFKKLDLFQAT